MKKRILESELTTAVVRIADRLLNMIVGFVLIAALLYSCFGLWDNWNVYHDASLDELMQYRPTVSDEEKSNPSLSELQKINSDVCAWLTVDGTNIDYPVLQGENNVTYVNTNIYGEFSLSGSIFLDYRSENDFSDYYSVIYGHHMAGEVMFGQLPDFLEKDYFQEHTTGTLFLPETTYKIEWFASMTTTAYDQYMYRLIAKEDGQAESQMEQLLTYIKENATQYREIGVTTSDRLVTLSTCSDTTTNGRTLLIGRMTP